MSLPVASSPPHLAAPFADGVPRGYWQHALVLSIALLAVIVVRLHESFPFLAPLRPALVLSVGGVLLLWANSAAEVRAAAMRDRLFVLVALYFAWAAATAPFALWRGLALNTVQVFIPATLLVLALMLTPATKRNAERLVFWFVAAAAVSAITLRAMGNTKAGRLEGAGSFDPNDLAAVMTMALPFAVSLVVRGRAVAKILGAVAAVLFLLVIIATNSRGGVVALCVSTVVYLLGFRGPRMIGLAIALAVGGAVAWQTAPTEFRERMLGMGNLEEDYNYTAYNGRKQIWARARGYIADSPAKGVGIGNFGVREGDHCREVHDRGCKWSTAHNSYLQVGVELGVPGMLLFVSIIGLGMRRALTFWRRSPKRPHVEHRPELLAAMAAFASAGYFLSLGYFYPFFGLVAIVTFVWRAQQTESAAVALGPSAPMATSVSAGWRTARSRERALAMAAPAWGAWRRE